MGLAEARAASRVPSSFETVRFTGVPDLWGWVFSHGLLTAQMLELDQLGRDRFVTAPFPDAASPPPAPPEAPPSPRRRRKKLPSEGAKRPFSLPFEVLILTSKHQKDAHLKMRSIAPTELKFGQPQPWELTF